MTEKEIVLQTVSQLPDDCSIDEIADRIEFLAAVQKGLDQLDRGEGIPHEEIKKQLATSLQADLVPASPDNLRDIVSFIARDGRVRAEAFGYRLIA
jgi:hypothetical protein